MRIHPCRLLLAALLILIYSSCKREVTSLVKADFDYIIVDSNYTVPVKIQLSNKSTGGLFYNWTFSKGSLTESRVRNPDILIVDKPGYITVKLEVWNDYERSEKSIEIRLDSVLKADFIPIPEINDYVPATYNFEFSGQGASRYQWFFEGGDPTSVTLRNPQNIQYRKPGLYTVTLIAINDRGKSDTSNKKITIKPELVADFEIIPSFEDDDFEAPLAAQLFNKTINATQHNWVCDGALINLPKDSLPLVQFTNPGIYTIVYTATNQKQTTVIKKSIEVKPNSRLREFKNVKLGINTAHKNIGSFFSTYLRKVITSDSVNATNGPSIDLCFFGLNNSFSFNKFISPTQVQNWTFNAIPGSKATAFINSQEKCNCSSLVSVAEYDQIINGNYFDPLTIPFVNDGEIEFNNLIRPRVILFQNSAGKKGAIKIVDFVDHGAESFIVFDLKMQKD